jgi:DNA-binding CsgD family transcriptional regulator
MDIYTYASAHEEMFNQMPGLIGLTTFDNRVAFANNTFAKLLGFKSSDDVVDIPYMNMRCKAVEDHESFEKQNSQVFSRKKKTTALGCHRYANDDDWRIILCEKSPLLNNEGEMIGLINYSIDITNYNLIDCSRFILSSLNKANIAHPRNFFYLIEDGTVNTYKLSKRQTECLFFLLRGKTDKEIGGILGLSSRTIESYINEIKFKMNCLTRTEVIEKAFSEGMANILPESFVNKCLKIQT